MRGAHKSDEVVKVDEDDPSIDDRLGYGPASPGVRKSSSSSLHCGAGTYSASAPRRPQHRFTTSIDSSSLHQPTSAVSSSRTHSTSSQRHRSNQHVLNPHIAQAQSIERNSRHSFNRPSTLQSDAELSAHISQVLAAPDRTLKSHMSFEGSGASRGEMHDRVMGSRPRPDSASATPQSHRHDIDHHQTVRRDPLIVHRQTRSRTPPLAPSRAKQHDTGLRQYSNQSDMGQGAQTRGGPLSGAHKYEGKFDENDNRNLIPLSERSDLAKRDMNSRFKVGASASTWQVRRSPS